MDFRYLTALVGPAIDAASTEGKTITLLVTVPHWQGLRMGFSGPQDYYEEMSVTYRNTRVSCQYRSFRSPWSGF